VKNFIEAFQAPLAKQSAEEALYLGGTIIPALDACLLILKSKLPKKVNAE
jgi:hypothetical protein